MKRYIKSAINPIDNDSLRDRYDFAQDFTASRRDLQHLADTDPVPNVRNAALRTLHHIDEAAKLQEMHGSHVLYTLRLFSDDTSPHIRWQIAQHPDLPIDILQKLANDEDSRVRKVAQSRLRELGL